MEASKKTRERIEELETTVENLKQAEENYRHLLQYAPTGICELDCNTPKFLIVNDAMCKLTGYTREELLAMSPFKLLEPESAERFKEHIGQWLAGAKLDENTEFRVITKDERHLWVQLFVKPIYRGGKVDSALVVGYDVTERKKADLALRESEESYRNLLETSPDAIVVHSGGKAYYANQAALRLYGAETFEHLAGPDFFSLVPIVDRLLAEKRTEKEALGQSVKIRQARIITLDKQVLPVEVSSSHIKFQGKDLAQTVIRDMTERKKAENALRLSEDKFSKAFRNSPIAVTLTSLVDGKVIDLNESAIRLFGFSREESVGKTVLELGTWANPAERAEFVKTLKEKGFVSNYEVALQRKDRSQIRAIVSVSSVELENEQCLLTSVVDITERKKAEEALKETEERFRSVLDNSLDVVYRFNLQKKRYEYMSPSIRRMGFEPQEMTSMTDAEVLSRVYPDDLPALRKELTRLGETGRGCCEYRFLGKDGVYRWWSNQLVVIRDENGEPVYRDGYVRDVTERKEAEKKLEDYARNLEVLVKERTQKIESTAIYARNLIEASIDPLVTISAEGKITDVNKATETVTGVSREELIGSDFSNYFTEPKKAEAGYKRVFKDGFVTDYPLAIKHKSGRNIDVLYNASVYRNEAGEIQGVFAAARDVTERKNLEQQLQDKERLAAIGATAGMVGHDIRNPLQAMVNDVYFAKKELGKLADSKPKESAVESLCEIERNIEYINKIVQDLQDYARPLNPKVEESDLKLIVEGVIAKNDLPENIKVTVEVTGEDGKVYTDSYYLHRILYNLITNSVQAMPDGGKLTIKAYKEAKDIVIVIKDTGVGIPEDVKPKMFTLMFTTKSKGQGFGLPVVKRLTESLGGTVTFRSQEGKGTVFMVRLPIQKN